MLTPKLVGSEKLYLRLLRPCTQKTCILVQRNGIVASRSVRKKGNSHSLSVMWEHWPMKITYLTKNTLIKHFGFTKSIKVSQTTADIFKVSNYIWMNWVGIIASGRLNFRTQFLFLCEFIPYKLFTFTFSSEINKRKPSQHLAILVLFKYFMLKLNVCFYLWILCE